MKSSAAVTLLLIASAVYSQTPAARSNYVGDAACASCHQDKTESFHKTGHFHTSSLPTPSSLLGRFAGEQSVLKTSNPDLYFRMEAKDGHYYESAITGQPPNPATRTEEIGIVIGSGRRGQTDLYWKDGKMFELPVSYWSELGAWFNSPGFPDGSAKFNWPITARCLECHADYFEAMPPPENRFRTTGFTLGLGCEKCHGPGKEHAQRYSGKTPVNDSAIVNTAKLPRDRQMDACALCHGGIGQPSPAEPSFSFIPGDRLEDFIESPPVREGSQVDVHGNQVALLERSRCFKSSSMTCTTCHDVHTSQQTITDFSARCVSCHSQPLSAPHPKLTATNNCIDCHMPNQKTSLIVFNEAGKKAEPIMRNHWIKVYSETR